MGGRQEVKVFAPASVSNVGPGFDVFGIAVHEPGDTVIARRSSKSGVRIVSIANDDGRLPLDARKNTAGVAATAVLRLLGVKEGVELELVKGMPGQSGLGSSGASAAAAAHAVNLLFGGGLRKEDLVQPCMDAEAAACGSGHADNVAPSLLGGFVVVQSLKPLVLRSLTGLDDLNIVLVHPNVDVPTRKARASVPKKIPVALATSNWAHTAVMAYAYAKGDLRTFCDAIYDPVVEPYRAEFIPGFETIRSAAREAGAWACSISGSGPTMFAITPTRDAAHPVGEAMRLTFERLGLSARVYATTINHQGTVAVEED